MIEMLPALATGKPGWTIAAGRAQKSESEP